tara:strand:+ start:4161 stop:4820 length:660 start_codon:yes stop_codon:yes gene_type:complete
MKSFFKSLLILSCIFISTSLFAQLDNNNGSEKEGNIKVIVKNNSKEVKIPKSLELVGKEGFKKAYDKEKEKLKQQQEEAALNNKGILTKEQLNNLRIKEMYGKREIKKVDSHQGNFLTLSKTLTLSFRDFGAIDGDIIGIYHNSILIVQKTTLNQHYQSFKIHLEKGDNKIEILALNQGSLGANTAQYKLVNGSGLKIASQYWFLATGARAIFNVTKSE